MAYHKFTIGQFVELDPMLYRNAPGGPFEITRRLPVNRGEYEYRIKNESEPHERIARESELRAV